MELLTSQNNDGMVSDWLYTAQPTLWLFSSLFLFCPWQRIIRGIQKPDILTSEAQEQKHLSHYKWSLWHYWYWTRIWIFFSPGLIRSKTFNLFINWIKSDICFLIFYTSFIATQFLSHIFPLVLIYKQNKNISDWNYDDRRKKFQRTHGKI